MGASKTLQKTVVKDVNGEETTITYPTADIFSTGFVPGGDFGWSLGLGFHLGEWDIDTLLSHEAPFRVGYWLTGFGLADGDPFVTRVSGTYRF